MVPGPLRTRSAPRSSRIPGPSWLGRPARGRPRAARRPPEPSLVFTVALDGLSRHAGEISFPGGLQDPGETLSETALRESFEEIGLAASDATSRRAAAGQHDRERILVVPFVGMLESPTGVHGQ